MWSTPLPKRHPLYPPVNHWPAGLLLRTKWCLRVCQVTSVMSSSLRPYGQSPTRLFCPWDSPGKNTGVGCHALLRGTFPTQGWNPRLLCLLHWQASSLSLAPPGKLEYQVLISNKFQVAVAGNSHRQRDALIDNCWCSCNRGPVEGLSGAQLLAQPWSPG